MARERTPMRKSREILRQTLSLNRKDSPRPVETRREVHERVAPQRARRELWTHPTSPMTSTA